MMTSSGVNSSAIAIIARWRMPPAELVRIALRWIGSMPTSFITSTERVLDRTGLCLPCASIASVNCAPIVVTGFSAFIALCMTTDRSAPPRRGSSAARSCVTRSSPRNLTLPPVIAAGGTAAARSRTAASTCRSRIRRRCRRTRRPPTSRSTPSTARTPPRSVAYSTVQVADLREWVRPDHFVVPARRLLTGRSAGLLISSNA